MKDKKTQKIKERLEKISPNEVGKLLKKITKKYFG